MIFTCHKIKSGNLYCSFRSYVEYFKHVCIHKLFRVWNKLLWLSYDFGPIGYECSLDFVRSRMYVILCDYMDYFQAHNHKVHQKIHRNLWFSLHCMQIFPWGGPRFAGGYSRTPRSFPPTSLKEKSWVHHCCLVEIPSPKIYSDWNDLKCSTINAVSVLGELTLEKDM